MSGNIYAHVKQSHVCPDIFVFKISLSIILPVILAAQICFYLLKNPVMIIYRVCDNGLLL